MGCACFASLVSLARLLPRIECGASETEPKALLEAVVGEDTHGLLREGFFELANER